MNRRNFVQATGALVVASLVPSLASAFPMPVDEKWAVAVKFGHNYHIGQFVSYNSELRTVSNRIATLVTSRSRICIAADHGYIFLSDGKELRKKEFPLLWNHLSLGDKDLHYTMDSNVFRLPRMQWPWESNYNIHRRLIDSYRNGSYGT